MSTRISIPGLILNKFRASFHYDFPYESTLRQDRVVLESSDGVRFHFPLQYLIDTSTVFADASQLAADDNHLRPIIPIASSTEALHHFLIVLRQSQSPAKEQVNELHYSVVTPGTIIATIRIAHMLDTPALARGLSSQVGLDIYLKYAINQTFNEVGPTSGDKTHTSPRQRDPVDISFSLCPNDQFQRAFVLLRETNPSAAQSLLNFHNDRQKAIRAMEQWWSTGVRVGRVLRSDRPPPTLHRRGCKRRSASGYAFARELPRITPASMLALSMSKSKKEREERVGQILAGRANGCKGCLARLEGVYMPALRSFNANFPASPK
jgi:hypothetical protein